jgi:hypothetical protein
MSYPRPAQAGRPPTSPQPGLRPRRGALFCWSQSSGPVSLPGVLARAAAGHHSPAHPAGGFCPAPGREELAHPTDIAIRVVARLIRWRRPERPG